MNCKMDIVFCGCKPCTIPQAPSHWSPSVAIFEGLSLCSLMQPHGPNLTLQRMALLNAFCEIPLRMLQVIS